MTKMSRTPAFAKEVVYFAESRKRLMLLKNCEEVPAFAKQSENRPIDQP